MPVPSRPFFDLSAVSELSRSLRRGGPVPGAFQPPPPAPTAEVSTKGSSAAPTETVAEPAPQVPPPAAGLGPFLRPQVEYAEQLWQSLLEWIREGMDARGVFALDMRGFFIAGVGEATPVPPEVLMASFTSVAQLLEAYLSGDHPLSELLIVAEQIIPVTVITLPWEKEGIYLGLYGGRMPSGEELGLLRSTVRGEMESFGSEAEG